MSAFACEAAIVIVLTHSHCLKFDEQLDAMIMALLFSYDNSSAIFDLIVLGGVQ